VTRAIISIKLLLNHTYLRLFSFYTMWLLVFFLDVYNIKITFDYD